MTQLDLSSLALPDSPELPADVESALQGVQSIRRKSGPGAWISSDDQPIIANLRRVIAKHLLTAEEARWLLEWASYYRFENETLFGKNDTALAKLRRLSGSSRREE